MDRNYIRSKTAEVIIECNIKSFPIDCFGILQHYGYKIYTYSELQEKNKELYEMCISYSEDAFRSGSIRMIAYNDKKPMTRIRFSLMHELGHHILGHKNDTALNESEANYFSSNLLAPRIAMYYAKCRLRSDVEEIFSLSSSASYYATQDFIEWCNEICQDGMHSYDRELYSQFYNAEYDGFVYSTKKCQFCGANVYNEKQPICKTVCKHSIPKKSAELGLLTPDDKVVLTRLHNNWLYNF